MPLGDWAEANQQVNELQEDFVAKTTSLVHSIMTERKIYETLQGDYYVLKNKME